MCTLTFVWYFTEVGVSTINQEKEMEVGKVRKEEIKPSLFVEDKIVSLGSFISTLELTSEIEKGCRIKSTSLKNQVCFHILTTSIWEN